MSYEFQFLPSALKEWAKLGDTVQAQFRKKLAEQLETPRIQADALHGMTNHYKVKLRASSHRLVYRVEDAAVTVTVIAVSKRERDAVYKAAERRAKSEDC